MSEHIRVGHPKELLLPTDVEGFDTLAELALDMRWTWNHATDQVWRRLDLALWDLTQNPWAVLQTASREKLQGVLAEPAFRKKLDDLLQARRDVEEYYVSPAVTDEINRFDSREVAEKAAAFR